VVPALRLSPLTRTPLVTVEVPGSKSITNRALLCAALAPGVSRLDGVLVADDTRAMVGAIQQLGATADVSQADRSIHVHGVDVAAEAASGLASIDAKQSGTTARFILPVLAVRRGTGVLDGSAQLRARPFTPLTDALRVLGASIVADGNHAQLPLTVSSPARGGSVSITGSISSQFISGLLIAGPLMPEGLRISVAGDLVSRPYVALTESVMSSFGVHTSGLTVAPQPYRPATYTVEPDASAASYFFAAAAITGGRVTVEGLGRASIQGDIDFVDVLEAMGAKVERSLSSTTVEGPSELRGVDVDMRHISDTAQTLAAVAVHANSATRVRGIGFIRNKETDRINAMVTELRRAGIEVSDDGDGFTVTPGVPRPTDFDTYDDHRMAMSLALLSLRTPGVGINHPECVNKTYPDFFKDFARLRR